MYLRKIVFLTLFFFNGISAQPLPKLDLQKRTFYAKVIGIIQGLIRFPASFIHTQHQSLLPSNDISTSLRSINTSVILNSFYRLPKAFLTITVFLGITKQKANIPPVVQTIELTPHSPQATKDLKDRLAEFEDSLEEIDELYLELRRNIFDQNIAALTQLFQTGIKADYCSDLSNTPLIVALNNEMHNIDVISLLLKNGAEKTINYVVSNNFALLVAVENELTSIVELLLAHNADVNLTEKKNNYTALHTAVYSDEVDIARLLLNHGAHLEARSTNGKTPLMIAAEFGKTTMVRMLIEEYGADTHATDNTGQNAHVYARSTDLAELISTLEYNKVLVKYAGFDTQQTQHETKDLP